jgi:hypothetical protein
MTVIIRHIHRLREVDNDEATDCVWKRGTGGGGFVTPCSVPYGCEDSERSARRWLVWAFILEEWDGAGRGRCS